MTNTELYNALTSIPGFENKVAFRAFPAAPAFPYICYLPTSSRNFTADNKVYAPFMAVQVELYTAAKDEAAEQKVEAMFDGHDIPYEKSEYFLESESCYEVLYEITI